jgi:hypothetical protein
MEFESASDIICICKSSTDTCYCVRVVWDVSTREKGRGMQLLILCRLTQFNVAIAVLSTFILIVKVPMFVLQVWYPILGTFTNLALAALYITSIYGQSGPDKTDMRFPSSSAWYITKSCSYARPSGNEHNCMMAKGAFAVTCVMT